VNVPFKSDVIIKKDMENWMIKGKWQLEVKGDTVNVDLCDLNDESKHLREEKDIQKLLEESKHSRQV